MFPSDHQMVMHGGQSRSKMLCRDEQQNNRCAIAALCHDILISILLPFPAKTLLGLKLVCKEFNDVISSPIFGITHLRTHHKDIQSLAPSGLYFYDSFSNTSEIYTLPPSNSPKTIPSLTFFECMAYISDRRFKVVQSCNGLLLCRFDNESSPLAREYFVCNPTTHAYTMLPELPPVESSSSTSKSKQEICHPILTLAFNPLQSTYGYKVFAIRVVKQLASTCTCEVLVYTSDNDGRVWRNCGSQFPISPNMKRIHHGVFHDGGMITWICETGFIHFNAEEENMIEVRRGALRSSSWRKIRFFGESIDGGLYLVKLLRGYGIKVFQLRPGTSTWEHRCTLFPQSQIILSYQMMMERNYFRYHYNPGHFGDMVQVLAVGNGGRLLILAIPGMVFGYCHQSWRSWMIRPMPERFPENVTFDCVTSFRFVETLCPV